ncbi:MAG TPA: CsgG/HfaB family protein [Nitrospirales bacterium]|nr:CsgG/HfaB family protein [Nitrospirales bacterium]
MVRPLCAVGMSLLMAACSSPSLPKPPAAAPAISSAKSGAPFPVPLIVSVLPFDDQTHEADHAWVRKGLPDMITAQLMRVPSAIVMQRARLDEVLREQSFQLSGRVADDAAVRVGRLAGATVLVTGGVTLAGQTARIDSQLVSVEQGIVLGTVNAEGPVAELGDMARVVALRTAELLPNGPAAMTLEASADMSAAARAAEAGETLAQAGKLKEALAAYERSLAADPTYAPARWGYGRVVQILDPRELMTTASRSDEAAVRLAERFFETAFVFETGTPKSERQADGTSTLRIPVRIRLLPEAVDALGDAATASNGSIKNTESSSGASSEIRFGTTDSSRAAVKELLSPRRLYLRLLAGDQRTVGVYSSLRDWVPTTWLTAANGTVHVARDTVVAGEAVFSGLTDEQAATLYGCRLSIERVHREQSTVRVEIQDAEPSAHEGKATSRAEALRIPVARSVLDALAGEWQSALERHWRPPVSERPWALGYRPGNERTAAVIFDPVPGATPSARLARSSGDSEFDEAALLAAYEAAAKWNQAVPASIERGSARARAQFRLIKDVPALNVIEPTSGARALRPSSQR